jgi:hypothetical protein
MITVSVHYTGGNLQKFHATYCSDLTRLLEPDGPVGGEQDLNRRLLVVLALVGAKPEST